MLENLYVKNVALIDESNVTFQKGLNILTGETGAGKSIIIGSINLALGAKADKNLIRNGAEYALVQLVFHVEDEQTIEKLKTMDIYPDEENRLLLERRITVNKSTSKINGELIANKTLKEAAEILIDIHGQHEHQSLLKKSHHFDVLDSFCEEELTDVKAGLEQKYKNCKALQKEIEELTEQGQNRDKELAFANYELNEIESAMLEVGEDEQLEARNRKMSNARKISQALSIADDALHGQRENASELISRAYKEINSVSEYDEALKDIGEQFATLEDIIFSVGHAIHDCQADLEFDESEFDEVQRRLNLINQLKAKYAKKTNSIEEIMERKEKLIKEVSKLEDFEVYFANKEKEYTVEKENLLKLCQKASNIRKKGAVELSKKMQKALVDLNFLQVEFEIHMESDEQFLTKDGFDDVEFMISLNPGEELKPLGEVASGGELSRIMLALKTVLADKDRIETLIFDEIDAGISGKTAWKVSEKMAILGDRHQVICITHLPQIAAMADAHFVIEKDSQNTSTKTTITSLNSEQMILEIARLLGSDVVTDTVLESAKELKILANKTKVY